MSTPTLTLVSAPEPAPESVTVLRDKLALAEQAHGDLLAAAKATLAAAAGTHRGNPLSWLREHLELLGQLPAPGTRPTDYVPADRGETTWGRW